MQKKFDEKSEDFEQCKEQFQILINFQLEKIKRLDATVAEKNNLYEETNKKLNSMYDNWKAVDVERVKTENKYFDLLKELKSKDDKLTSYELVISDKSKKIEFYEDTLKRQAKESAELANKLAELKNAIIDDNMMIHNFKGEKLGTFFNTTVELKFEKADENMFALVIQSGDDKECINVEDIDYFKKSDKYETAIELCFYKNAKPVKMNILFLESTEKILKVYHDYLQKSILSHHYSQDKDNKD